uniref:F-box domain-containing protein n=1 Tax=Setaria viridis TaxID=4556 RepID=A0A4U6T774_SETVI|nr:hypothetical protein SEVIR_9G438200v2 [Setaria viridis]
MAEPAALEPEPRQADAAAFFRDSPPRVIIEIFRRLPARSILRLRSVCTVLRDVTSYRPLLAAVHLLHPPQPLICFGRNACPDRYIQLRDYCVEALDLRSDTLRPIFRFTDNEYHNDIANDEGFEPPPIFVFSKDNIHYGEMDGDGGGHDPRLMVHASIDGLLLVSFINSWYVCNPATRQWAALPDLRDCDVIGLYEHVSSGEYRVLYHTGKDDEEASTCYYVLTIRRITIQVPRIPALQYIDWFPRVVSPEGDVLIECENKLVLHCDRIGNLLQKFQFREETPLVRHTLKETLLPHAIFLAPKPDDAIEPPFFQGL